MPIIIPPKKKHTVLDDATDPMSVHYVDDTTQLKIGHYGKSAILNNVFALVVDMINTLQLTAAVQANRLNFLTAWQQAYTSEMNQIHSFVGTNGDQGDGNGVTTTLTHSLDGVSVGAVVVIDAGGNYISEAGNTNSGSLRSMMNQTNTTYTTEMQGDNQVISNDAKTLQTYVNQTNDAVQQQSDLCTSILQQLSTILTSIFSSS